MTKRHYSLNTGSMMRCVAQEGKCKYSQEQSDYLKEQGIIISPEELHNLSDSEVEELNAKAFATNDGRFKKKKETPEDKLDYLGNQLTAESLGKMSDEELIEDLRKRVLDARELDALEFSGARNQDLSVKANVKGVIRENRRLIDKELGKRGYIDGSILNREVLEGIDSDAGMKYFLDEHRSPQEKAESARLEKELKDAKESLKQRTKERQKATPIGSSSLAELAAHSEWVTEERKKLYPLQLAIKQNEIADARKYLAASKFNKTSETVPSEPVKKLPAIKKLFRKS